MVDLIIFVQRTIVVVGFGAWQAAATLEDRSSSFLDFFTHSSSLVEVYEMNVEPTAARVTLRIPTTPLCLML